MLRHAATVALIAPLLASCAGERPVVVTIIVDPPDLAAGQVAVPDRRAAIAGSCDEIHAYWPELPSGIYSVQPP